MRGVPGSYEKSRRHVTITSQMSSFISSWTSELHRPNIMLYMYTQKNQFTHLHTCLQSHTNISPL